MMLSALPPLPQAVLPDLTVEAPTGLVGSVAKSVHPDVYEGPAVASAGNEAHTWTAVDLSYKATEAGPSGEGDEGARH